MQARFDTAAVVVRALEGYLGVGLAVALLFSLFAVARVDAGAGFDRGSPVGSAIFRLLVIPATTLLWPVVLWRAIALSRAARRAPTEDPHAGGPS